MTETTVGAGEYRVEVLVQYGGQSWERYGGDLATGPGIRFRSAKEAWQAIDTTVMAWGNVLDARVMREGDPVPFAVYSCSQCGPFMAGEMAPSHRGSPSCESGSLASGGTHSHCACDRGCF